MAIIITGVSKGIGKQALEELEKHYDVVGCSRTIQEQETSNKLILKINVNNQKDLQRLVDKTMKKFGKIQALILNAGLGTFSKLEETTEKEYDEMYNTNLKSTFNLLKLALPILKKQNEGQIIAISSMAGLNPVPNGSVYASTKWALQGMIKSLKQELRETNIKVALIQPGSVKTHFFDKTSMTPNPQRILTPKDISRVITFILEQPTTSDIDEISVRPAYNPKRK